MSIHYSADFFRIFLLKMNIAVYMPVIHSFLRHFVSLRTATEIFFRNIKILWL